MMNIIQVVSKAHYKHHDKLHKYIMIYVIYKNNLKRWIRLYFCYYHLSQSFVGYVKLVVLEII